MLPNVHIIGAQKAATTSLFHWLGQHEDIYAPLSAKDYPVFASDNVWVKGLDDYAKLFKNRAKQKIVLAGSVHTLKFNHARKRLYETFPDARIIVVLRDPTDRLLSAYNYRFKAGVEPLEFSEALKQEQDRAYKGSFEDRAGGAYVSHGLYYKQLKSLMELYSSRQIKIVWFEEIEKNPELVVSDIFSFLGVDKKANFKFDKKNVTGKIRVQWFFDLCFNDNKLKRWLVRVVISKMISLEMRTKLRHWLKEKNTMHVNSVKPYGFDRKEIIPLFIKDIELLERLTGRDLNKWKR